MKNTLRSFIARFRFASHAHQVMRSSFMILLMALSPIGLANCAGSSNSSTTTTGYSLTNGVCYVTGTSTVVATAYCSTTSTTGYSLTNGVCYVTGTSTVVATTYCSTTSTIGTTSTICYGSGYYSPTQGIYGTCYGPQYNNCSGLTLIKGGVTYYCQ